jgi:enediyne biosynthesis protein E4
VTEATAAAPAVGDFNGDGHVDVYVTNLDGNTLLRNEGGGRFTDVSAEAGVDDPSWSSSAAFFDYDMDGLLDLFVANFIGWSLETEIECRTASGMRDYCGPTSYSAPAKDRLYRNNGDGSFTDVSIASGIAVGGGNGLGVVVLDFDLDGDPDIFVANDGLPDELWVNDGAGGFVDQAALLGVAVDEAGRARAGMGTHAADIDGDGDEDIIVVNLVGETDGLYLNETDYFVEVTSGMGIASHTLPYTRFGVGFHDFDADGRMDLFVANGRVRWQGDLHVESDPFAEPNQLFRGVEGGFEPVPLVADDSAMAVATSRGAAFGDLDGDGAIDILVVNRDGPPSILRNIAPRGGRSLRVRAVEPSGSDSLGARVVVSAGGRDFVGTVRSAYSYCSSSDPAANFGLGAVDVIDAMTVTWPIGVSERFEPPAEIDGTVVLERGQGELVSIDGPLSDR